jgi:hypothetical protein
MAESFPAMWLIFQKETNCVISIDFDSHLKALQLIHFAFNTLKLSLFSWINYSSIPEYMCIYKQNLNQEKEIKDV